MPWNRSPEARTVRRTAAGAFAGGFISILCGCPLSRGIGSALELALLYLPFSARELGFIAWGGLILSGVAIGAALGYLARDLNSDDLR